MNTHRRTQREPTPEGRAMRDGLLREIVRFRDEHGYPPTLRELAASVGLSSTSVVTHHLLVMERQGVIERKKGASRGIKVLVDVLY